MFAKSVFHICLKECLLFCCNSIFSKSFVFLWQHAAAVFNKIELCGWSRPWWLQPSMPALRLQMPTSISRLWKLFLLPAHFPVLWSQECFILGAEPNTTLGICSESAKLVHSVWPLVLVAGNVFISGVSQALLIFLQSAGLWFHFQMVTYSFTIYHLYR